MQCRDALRLVAQALPDRGKDRMLVTGNALACITVDGDDRQRAAQIVERFVDACPRCWGVDRTNRYWGTLQSFFDREEVLELYLTCFPDDITADQRKALKRNLVNARGYDEHVVDQALQQRFVIRQNRGCRAPGACERLW